MPSSEDLAIGWSPSRSGSCRATCPALLDEARAAVGRFLDADPEGLAFVANATTGYNAVLQSLRFAPGDELLTNDHEYNATINAMRAVAARDGATVVVVPIPFPTAGPEVVRDAILGAVTDRTRLVVVSQVTSPTALVFPVAEIVAELAARGIDTLVDGAHAPGMVPAGIDALGAAYWTGNGHKWLCGPKGAAVLWVREDRRDRVHPLVVSHGANAVLGDRSRFRHEFDWVGTADPTGFLTLPAAIDWMAAQAPGGWPEVMASNRALALDGRDRLCAALDIEPPAPDSMIGSMATLPLPWVGCRRRRGRAAPRPSRGRGSDPGADRGLARAGRADRGVRPQAFVRISAQRYNEPADYDRLAEALARARDRDQSLRVPAASRSGPPGRDPRSGASGPARSAWPARSGSSAWSGPMASSRTRCRTRCPRPPSGSRPWCPRRSGAAVWVPEPLEPPEPSDGAVVPGDADGSGLAADTTAAAPPTSRSPEMAAVRSARRTPELVDREA